MDLTDLLRLDDVDSRVSKNSINSKAQQISRDLTSVSESGDSPRMRVMSRLQERKNRDLLRNLLKDRNVLWTSAEKILSLYNDDVPIGYDTRDYTILAALTIVLYEDVIPEIAKDMDDETEKVFRESREHVEWMYQLSERNAALSGKSTTHNVHWQRLQYIERHYTPVSEVVEKHPHIL